MLRFKCTCCDQWHEGIPALSAEAPLYYYYVPENERDQRCRLTTETCVVDEDSYFVRGCLEIPIQGSDEKFEWGVWVSLSAENFLSSLVFCKLNIDLNTDLILDGYQPVLKAIQIPRI